MTETIVAAEQVQVNLNDYQSPSSDAATNDEGTPQVFGRFASAPMTATFLTISPGSTQPLQSKNSGSIVTQNFSGRDDTAAAAAVVVTDKRASDVNENENAQLQPLLMLTPPAEQQLKVIKEEAGQPVFRQVSDPVTTQEKRMATKRHIKKNGEEQNLHSGSITSQVSFKIRSFIDSNTPRGALKRSISIFYCKICMGNNPLDEAAHVEACPEPHLFCTDCLSAYLASQVNDGVVKIICPDDSCAAEFSVEEVEHYVHAEVFKKLERFAEMKSNPQFRECGKCNAKLHVEIPTAELNSNNCMLTCKECMSVSCFYHGDSHPNETCKAYTKRMGKIDAATQRMMSRTTRRCPTCRTPTEKNGGCNHMTCQKCKADWCWLCGRIMGDNHYDPLNLIGCPGGQFAIASDFALWSFIDNLNCCCGAGAVGYDGQEGDGEEEDGDIEMGGGGGGGGGGRAGVGVPPDPSCCRKSCISFLQCLIAVLLAIRSGLFLMMNSLSALEHAFYMLNMFIALVLGFLCALVGIVAWLPVGALCALFLFIKGGRDVDKGDYFQVMLPLSACLVAVVVGSMLLAIEVCYLCVALPFMLTWPLLMSCESIGALDKDAYTEYFFRPVLRMAALLNIWGGDDD